MTTLRTGDRDAARAILEDRRRALNGAPTPPAIVPDDALPAAVCLLDAPPSEPVSFLVDELLTDGDVALFVGADGSMKSTLALHLAGAIAGGYRAFGRFATQPRPVVVVSGEDPRGVIANRIEAIIRGHGWSRSAVLGNLHVLALAGVDLVSRRWQAHLRAEVERIGAGVIVYDPLIDLASGDENDNSQRRDVVRAIRSIAQPTGAVSLMIHHAGKPGPEKAKRDRIRGASALAAASRCTYFVEKSDGGVRVECLKLSRGEKAPPFVVRATIVATAENRTVWEHARFEHVSATVAALDTADEFVLGQLEGGARMTTTDLKAAAKGTGVSGADIARSLKHLETCRRIDFEAGERGAKLWGLLPNATLPGKVGKVANDLAGQGATLPGNHETDRSTLPSPYRGLGRQGGTPSVGQGDADAQYEADERRALEEGL